MGDNTASMIQMLSSPDFIENPYPAFARIRQQEPICFLQPFNAWLLTRFEDVQTAFTDDRFQFQYEQNQINRLGTRALEQRSEEHTSELQSLMRNSYDGFCLKKKQ